MTLLNNLYRAWISLEAWNPTKKYFPLHRRKERRYLQ